jgi:hypothetical protein
MSPLTESTRLTLAKGQPVPNDPYLYTNTVLLLHGDGTNGSTNIVDSSKVAGSPKTVTAVGNAQISTAIADPFGTSSRGVLAFDGNGDYLDLAAEITDFGFETNSFTIEMWLRLGGIPGSGSKYTILDFRPTGLPSPHTCYVANTAGILNLGFFNGTSDITSSSVPLSSGSWYHCAWVKHGSTRIIFVNGIQAYSGSDSINYLSTRRLRISAGIGAPSVNQEYFNGYIDDLRITKNVARYTSNFTPPTLPFPDF